MIKAGQRYSRTDGSHVRVDSVGKGQVYFVSWKPGQEQGCPIRMLITDFEIAIRNEKMTPERSVLPEFEYNDPCALGYE